ncbi:MAG TPA: RNA polymerase sigma factor [Candidatus Polarisedimenticolaceae bacterium]|nr:RNA polymerase sigma factor [Candidatus Polarisedimenticolaceae bacterium]
MPLTDEQLIGEVRAGSSAAFEQVVRRYERLVFHVAFGVTADRDAALDVSQNVFLRLHAKLPAVHAVRGLKPWLTRVAVNESINWNRAVRRRPVAELNDRLTVGGPSPEERVSRRETWDMLRRSLESLGTRHRLAVVLRYVDGMPIREIATALGCNEGVAKSILFRSLKRMRGHLARTEEIAK